MDSVSNITIKDPPWQIVTTTATLAGQGVVELPQILLTIMNAIALIAVGINLVHIVFMTSLNPGRSVGALNFKRYILVLAYIDLVVSVARLGLDNRTVQAAMYNKHVLCVASATFMHGIIVFETHNLALVSIERYISVRWPDKYSTLFFTKHYPKIMLAALCSHWTVYIALAGMYSQTAYTVKGSGGCRLGSDEVPKLGYVTTLLVTVNIIIIILFYILFLTRVFKTMRGLRSTSPSVYRRLKQAAIAVNVLVLTKLVCWMPLLVAIILRGIYKRTIIEIDYIGRVLIMFYCIIGPILYGSTSERYRRFIKKRFCNRSSKNTNTGSSGTSVATSAFSSMARSNQKIFSLPSSRSQTESQT